MAVKNKRKANNTRKKLGFMSSKIKFVIRSIFIFIFAVLVGIVLSCTIFFKIEKIEFGYSSRYGEEELRENSGININDNIFLLDEKEVSKKMQKKLPYIDEVEIIKKIPSEVLVNVKDSKIDGYVYDNGCYFGINYKGKVLERFENKTEKAFVIDNINFKELEIGEVLRCQDENQEKILLLLLKILNDQDFKNISEINLFNLSDINLIYEDRIKIELGVCENLNYKIRTAKEVVKNRLQQNEKGILDLSTVDNDNKSYFKAY